MKIALKKLFKLLLLILIWAVVLEGGSRLVLSSRAFFERICNADTDAAWRLRWVERHKSPGILIYYPFDIYDPLRGWALKPSLTDFPVSWGTVSSNSKGLRGKVEYNYEKQEGRPRILILGDSFTFGDEVSDDETYPYYLQQYLPDSEVINFGVHGYGHDQMLVYFQEEGRKYRPDIVIVGFVGEDMPRNLLSFRDYGKPRFTMESGRLRLTNVPVPPPQRVLGEEAGKSRFLDLLDILAFQISSRVGLHGKRTDMMTKRILLEMAARISDAGALPVFVYLDRLLAAGPEATAGEKEFFAYWESRGVTCLSVRPYIPAQLKGSRPSGGHYDKTVNHLIAQALKDHYLNELQPSLSKRN